ncbi:MAG: MBL fold metallo-hydrolase, partial [Chloroflexi bacterium]|nr:MBL fold metallo-hydrolase [Chloroflexota bacterium]
MPSVTPVDEGTYCIDLEFQGQPGVIAAYLVEDAGERALIEIGPTSTLDTLLAALESIDVEPESISRILVTHIHLDHAGASGTWLRRFPGAELFVHEVGAPH